MRLKELIKGPLAIFKSEPELVNGSHTPYAQTKSFKRKQRIARTRAGNINHRRSIPSNSEPKTEETFAKKISRAPKKPVDKTLEAERKFNELVDRKFKTIEELAERIQNKLDSGVSAHRRSLLFFAFIQELNTLIDFARARKAEESQKIFARLEGFVRLTKAYEYCEITQEERLLLREARHDAWEKFLRSRLKSPVIKKQKPSEEIVSLTTKKSPEERARLKAAETRYKAKQARTRLNELLDTRFASLEELSRRIKNTMSASKGRNKLIRIFSEAVNKLNQFVKEKQLAEAQRRLTPFIETMEKLKKGSTKQSHEAQSKGAKTIPSLRPLEKLKEAINKALTSKASGNREMLIRSFCARLGKLRPKLNGQLDSFVTMVKTWLSNNNLSQKERTLLEAI